MRIDKYLKVSRLIKRRTLAAEACSQGRVLLNGKAAKASAEAEIGDKITIQFGEKSVTVQITSVSEHALKADAAQMYEAIDG